MACAIVPPLETIAVSLHNSQHNPSHGVPAVVLVEPICRGSRLQILASSAAAFAGRRPVIVLTREDYLTDHFREIMASLAGQVQVVAAPLPLSGVWIRTLTSSELRALLGSLRQICAAAPTPPDVVFLALDDYLLAFAKAAWWWPRRLRARRIWALKYRVEYLRRWSARPRALALAAVTRVALRLWRSRLGVFDERLRGRKVGGRAVAVLPDPWSGDFRAKRRAAARARWRWEPTQVVALAIGRQDERKGFPLVMAAFAELLPRHPEVRLWVVGEIVAAYRDAFAEWQQRSGAGRVVHQPGFVPEADLPDIFAAADIVLLPYATGFTASSGVLPRAAASGVPVLAAHHGLVGHRVKRWGLGETFCSGSSADFQRVFEQWLRNRKSATYPGLAQFAASCTEAAFATALRQAVEETA